MAAKRPRDLANLFGWGTDEDEAEAPAAPAANLADLFGWGVDDDDDDDRPTKRQRTVEPAPAEKVEDLRTLPATVGGAKAPSRPLVQSTLLGGAEFSRGALQTPKAVRDSVRVTSKAPTQVLAKRHEHNALTLASPTLRPLVELIADRATWLDGKTAPHDTARQVGCQMFVLAREARQNPDATQAQRASADLISAVTETQLRLALAGKNTGPDVEAPQLISARRTHPPRSVRLVDPLLGPIGSASSAPLPATVSVGGGKKAVQHAAAAAAYQTALLSYYADDPEPDPELPFGLPPASYPSVAAIEESRHAYLARRSALRYNAENTPRVSIPIHTRAYLQRQRNPCAMFHEAEMRRPCARQSACTVYVLAYKESKPGNAYNPPELLLKSEEDALLVAVAAGPTAVRAWYAKRGPAGLCVDCTLWDWSIRVLMFERTQQPPPHPINTFRVLVGQDEYGEDALLRREVEGVGTGIEGHVPAYDESYRQFDTLENGLVLLREVNVDFQCSLSQMNACLGVRKARPLAGTSRNTLPLHSLATVLGSSAIVDAVPSAVGLMWTQFLRSLPLPVLGDRALFEAKPDRVPAIWLRLYNFTTTTPTPHFTEAAGNHLRRRTALAVLRRAAQALGVPGAGLEAALLLVGQAAFQSFEDSLCWLLARSGDADDALVVGPLVHYMAMGPHVAEALVRPPGWTPATAFSRDMSMRPTHVLFSTALWRIAVADMFERVIGVHDLRYVYMTQLFADTHLDLLTLFTARTIGGLVADDRFLLEASAAECRLAYVYPQATRVCCAEELPGLGPLLRSKNRFHDMPNKKQNTAQWDLIAQVYLKTDSHVGKMRSSDDIFPKAMAAYEGIHAMFLLALRCALLGNFPTCYGRPPLPARIRINACFVPLTALTPTGKEVEGRAAEVRKWVSKHPMLTIALLREHYLYAMELETPMDFVLGQQRNWPMFKAVARLLTTQIRRAVSDMLLADGGRGRVDWEGLETREGGNKKTSKGEIVKWHEKEKEFNTKLFKDVDYGIMLKKMTSVERKHVKLRMANGDLVSWVKARRTKKAAAAVGSSSSSGGPDDETEAERKRRLKKESKKKQQDEEDAWFYELAEDDLREWLNADGRGEFLHTAAWLASQTMALPFPDGTVRPSVLTGPLKLAGMGQEAFASLRAWLHATADYHTSDDSFSKVSRVILRRDWRDFMLLKVYLRLVAYYTKDALSYLSIEQTRAQFVTLRNNLAVRGYVATPPALGFARYCEACLKWAAVVLRPSREYLGLVRPHVAAHAPKGGRKAAAAAAAAPEEGGVKRKRKLGPRPWPPKPIFLSDGSAGCTRGTAYDPHRNQLMCLCGYANMSAAAAADAAVGAAIGGGEEEEEEEGETEEEEEEEEEGASRVLTMQTAEGAEAAPEEVSLARRNGLRTDIAQWLLDGARRGQPLVTVDLVGVLKRHKNALYGLCCYCGRLCEVVNSNFTNGGLSCGEHAFPLQYPKWHPIWRHIRYPANKAQTMPVGHFGPDRPCYYKRCGHKGSVGEAQFWVYDAFYTVRRITLCGYHVTVLRAELSKVHAGERPALLRLAVVMQVLRAAE